MTRRDSDEVSLDIVMALLVGIPVGLVVAFLVGGTGWMTGHDFGGFAGWLGVGATVIAVAVALRRLERSARRGQPEA